MADKVQELYDAAMGVLPYLELSGEKGEKPGMSWEEYRAWLTLSEGERLRRRAEEADKRDAAITRLREALAEFAAE